MKLRNKKTGEVVVFGEGVIDLRQIGCKNVAEMIEAGWEDYEEPKKYWLISPVDADVEQTEMEGDEVDTFNKQIGNYFETKEEAEKAVEKLKAYKRLKDKGFDFVGCFKDNTINYEFVERPLDYDEAEEAEQDLAFLFGGEE